MASEVSKKGNASGEHLSAQVLERQPTPEFFKEVTVRDLLPERDTALLVTTVSVIMTVFQVERFVADAIQSVVLQTLDDLALWGVNDDASTDKTDVIPDGFWGSRINILPNSQNLRPSHSVDLVQKKAPGEHVARLDAAFHLSSYEWDPPQRKLL